MADPLKWKDGEGYDIHLLRGGLPSKALDQSIEIDPQFPVAQFPLEFEAHFKGAPNSPTLGVAVNTGSGVVTATAPTGTSPAVLRNFLMTASQRVTGGPTFENIIRIHLHNSIQKIWLTPSTLSVHEDTKETRFTVLALFDDGVVGDITEWPQLAYTVPNPSSLPLSAIAVKVTNTGDVVKLGEEEVVEIFGGRLTARVLPGDDQDQGWDVNVNLKLSSPPVDLSAAGKVLPKPGWDVVGNDPNTKVNWVAGPKKPNENDVASSKADSITSVVKSRANILFVSEGFLPSQEQDFRQKVVDLTVKELRTQDPHEPFKLLSGSINYWSVFVPSQDEGISLLGDYEIFGTSPKQAASEVPRPVPPAQLQWTVENMVHEAGLPAQRDAPAADSAAWLGGRTPLYDLPATVSVNAKVVADWNNLRQHTLLNERNTAFGLAYYDRPRASGQGLSGEERLAHDPRRISEASIKKFVENLQFSGFLIGSTWEEHSGPDFQRVCFVCQSSKTVGTATGSRVYVAADTARASRVYVAAGTGLVSRAQVEGAANGTNVKPRRIDKSFSIPVYASVVAHVLGHAFNLGDEYGGNDAFNSQIHPIPFEPNLQPDTQLAPVDPSTGVRVFDSSLIKWLWHRVSKAGVLDGPPDFQGNPDPVQFVVRLRKGDGKPFAKKDLVRIRKSPVRQPTSSDPYAHILFEVDFIGPDAVTVSYKNGGGPHVDLSLFNPSDKYLLVCTSIRPGIEFRLVADPILNRIATINAPLTGAVCVVGGGANPVTSPTNLPSLSKRPPNNAEIIGLYEGGGYHDCGVFRPAGRCRMRGGDPKTIPFCHVCRYVIVDTVDPTRHGELDTKLYDKVYPA
jgi:IgA Peptidase M64